MNTLLVDDEPLPLRQLQKLLEDHFPQVRIAGQAGNAATAEKLITTLQPNLVLLDVAMPGESGIDMLARLPAINFAVIFITAHQDYAIRAFRLAAIDYLLKPVKLEELQEAIRRAEQYLVQKHFSLFGDQLKLMMQNMQQKPAKLALPQGDKLKMVSLDDIMYCQSQNNYTFFYIRDQGRLLVSKGMYLYEEALLSAGFVRCHISYMVNPQQVKMVHRSGGIWQLEMNNDTLIPVSRQRHQAVSDGVLAWRRW